jgi:hypothetical protein
MICLLNNHSFFSPSFKINANRYANGNISSMSYEVCLNKYEKIQQILVWTKKTKQKQKINNTIGSYTMNEQKPIRSNYETKKHNQINNELKQENLTKLEFKGKKNSHFTLIQKWEGAKYK